MSLSKRKVPDIDFDKAAEKVKRLITYKRITFYVTDGPQYPAQERAYVEELEAKGVQYLVRTNYNHYNTDRVLELGIEVLDINFRFTQIPSEDDLNAFVGQLEAYRSRKRKVSVAIQGYENGPFVTMYGLMNLGMRRNEAIGTLCEVHGEASAYQLQYLKTKEGDINVRLDLRQRQRQVMFLRTSQCSIL